MDGILIEAVASLKSFWPKEEPPPSTGLTAEPEIVAVPPEPQLYPRHRS